MDTCDAFFQSAGQGDCSAVRAVVAPQLSWFGRALARDEWTPSSLPMRRMIERQPSIEGRREVHRDLLTSIPRTAYYEFARRAFGEAGSQGSWYALDLRCQDVGLVTVLVNLNADGLVRCVRDGTHLAGAVAWLKTQAGPIELKGALPMHPAWLGAAS